MGAECKKLQSRNYMWYSDPISASTGQGNMDKSIKLFEIQLLYLQNGDNYICPANFRGLLLNVNMREKAFKSSNIKYYMTLL